MCSCRERVCVHSPAPRGRDLHLGTDKKQAMYGQSLTSAGVHTGVKIHAGVGVRMYPWVRDDAEPRTWMGNTQGMQTHTHKWRHPGAKGCAHPR